MNLTKAVLVFLVSVVLVLNIYFVVQSHAGEKHTAKLEQGKILKIAVVAGVRG